MYLVDAFLAGQPRDNYGDGSNMINKVRQVSQWLSMDSVHIGAKNVSLFSSLYIYSFNLHYSPSLGC